MAQAAEEPRPPASATVEVVDTVPARVRRTMDLFRLAGLLLVLFAIAGLGTVASDTARAANSDLTRLLNQIPHLFIRALSLLGSLGVVALPIALVIREILRGQSRRLLEGLLTGVLAIGIVGGLDVAISARSSSALHGSLTTVAAGTTARPLDAYLAALVALCAVVGVAAEPVWRTAFWLAIGVYVLSAFVAQQASVLSLVASLAIGATVGIAVRYVAGSANERPDGQRVADELRRRDIALCRIERRPGTGEPFRNYHATTVDGRPLTVQVFDRDLIASGALYGLYRRLRIRAAVAAPPALSLERVAERRSLLAMAAATAGVRTPPIVAGVPCGPDTIVLVYADVAARPLERPTTAQLDDLWRNVERLHHARMTNRGLTAGHILVDDADRVVLPIPADGAVFASELRISLARAQVLIATAQMVGAQRAVQVARAALTDDQLAATMPLLQPVALPRETRAALKKDDSLLTAVRDQIQRQTRHQPPEPIRVERFRPRTIVSIAALIVAGYLVVGQLGSVDLVTVFTTARWGWVPAVLLASAGTYFAAGLSLTGYVQEKLLYLRTVLAQLAASFAGFVTPPSVGGLAVNIRYLRQSKLTATAATVSVSVSQVVNSVAHVVLLIVLAAATGAASETSLPIPSWAFIAVGVLAVLILGALAVPAVRRWVLRRTMPTLREALPRLLDLVTSPAKLAQALIGTLLLNACYVAALWFAVRAFGGSADVIAVAVVYLAGAGVASMAPTPGGLGAVELALSTGLAATGMPSAAAVSAVLLFRIATFWLPVPVGWLAFHHLQREGAL